MSDLLHLPVTGNDLVVAALSHDLDRLVAVGVDGQQMRARTLAETISRVEQFITHLDPVARRIAILARNRLEVLPVILGVGFSGAVQVALHPAGSVSDYLYVIEDAEIDMLIYDATYYEEIARELRAQAPGLKHIFSMGDGSNDIMVAIQAFEPQPLVARPADPNALSRIAYSGGTTGKPKGILSTVGSGAASTLIQLTSWEFPRELRHLICAPLSHAGIAMLHPVLIFGGVMYVIDAFEPVAVMQAIERHRITSVLMVPTMVIKLIDHPRFGEFDLSSLEIVYYGASPFPVARLREAIAKMGPIFFQFYGQAEAPMSITVMRRDEHDMNIPDRLASCGRPTPLIRVALLDDANRPVSDNMPGEICVRGPLVMGGYLNRPEETAQVFAGDWLHTGDVAIRDDDGFLRIVDRKKDMIISGGFNIFAREIEDVLAEQPGVAQAAVIGVPDDKWGEAVKAVIVSAPGAVRDPDALIRAVRERKGAMQAPKSVDYVDVLPLSPLGKIDKKALRQIFAV